MTDQSNGSLWPPDTAARIKAARDRGASFEAIARDFGVSFAALRNKAIALGMHTAVPRRKFSPEEDRLIRADYLAHVDVAVTAAKLGRAIGVTGERVRQICDHYAFKAATERMMADAAPASGRIAGR